MAAAGSLDLCKDGHVAGWAKLPDTPDAATVEIRVDGKLVESRVADLLRPDLEAAGIGNGRHGFAAELPRSFRDDREHTIAVSCNGVPLNGSPKPFVWAGPFTAEKFSRDGTWIDRPDALARLASPPRGREYAALRDLAETGAAVLPGLVPADLCDRVVRDVERAWRERPRLRINAHGLGEQWLAEVGARGDIPEGRYRLMDLHNLSEAAAELALFPPIVAIMRALFEATPVAMQTLFFENGSQQRAHQDFAFVHTKHPAILSAAWIACEDVHPDAGPVFYYLRSHREVAKYDFGDGNVLAFGDGPHVRAFEDYLAEACERQGLERVVFCPRKGDVLLWHSALVHGGSPRSDRGRSRRSLVTHYSTAACYPEDRRHPDTAPIIRERNGGIYFAWQAEGHRESAYPLREA